MSGYPGKYSVLSLRMHRTTCGGSLSMTPCSGSSCAGRIAVPTVIGAKPAYDLSGFFLNAASTSSFLIRALGLPG